MHIFKSLRDIVDNTRIAVSYISHERRARAEHIASAARRFSTATLEKQAHQRMVEPCNEAARRFTHPINDLQSHARGVRADLDGDRDRLAIFERDYASELDQLFARKAELNQKLHLLKDAKLQAQGALQEACDDLSSWHAKSQRSFFFGNGGKKLPAHSLFGQSLGDRDQLQSDRDDAWQDLSDCKNEMNGLWGKLQEVKGRIEGVKSDRQRMFALRHEGHCRAGLQHSMAQNKSRLARMQENIHRLQKECDEFMLAARYRTGTVAIDAEIENLKQFCSDFVKSFDDDEVAARRRSAFRQAWLKQRRA